MDQYSTITAFNKPTNIAPRDHFVNSANNTSRFCLLPTRNQPSFVILAQEQSVLDPKDPARAALPIIGCEACR